jgi:hypothetical protein
LTARIEMAHDVARRAPLLDVGEVPGREVGRPDPARGERQQEAGEVGIRDDRLGAVLDARLEAASTVERDEVGVRRAHRGVDRVVLEQRLEEAGGLEHARLRVLRRVRLGLRQQLGGRGRRGGAGIGVLLLRPSDQPLRRVEELRALRGSRQRGALPQPLHGPHERQPVVLGADVVGADERVRRLPEGVGLHLVPQGPLRPHEGDLGMRERPASLGRRAARAPSGPSSKRVASFRAEPGARSAMRPRTRPRPSPGCGRTRSARASTGARIERLERPARLAEAHLIVDLRDEVSPPEDFRLLRAQREATRAAPRQASDDFAAPILSSGVEAEARPWSLPA